MFRSIPVTEGVSTTDIVGRMLLLHKEHHIHVDNDSSDDEGSVGSVTSEDEPDGGDATSPERRAARRRRLHSRKASNFSSHSKEKQVCLFHRMLVRPLQKKKKKLALRAPVRAISLLRLLLNEYSWLWFLLSKGRRWGCSRQTLQFAKVPIFEIVAFLHNCKSASHFLAW